MTKTIIDLLREEFLASLPYYPAIKRMPNIYKSIDGVLQKMAHNMVSLGQTSSADFEMAKERLAMLQMSLISSVPANIYTQHNVDTDSILADAMRRIAPALMA